MSTYNVHVHAAKIPVGLMSGYLLENYIDEDHCDKGRAKTMWLIIGLATISSPILITIFDRCLREPMSNRHGMATKKQDVIEDVASNDDVEGEFLNAKE